MSGRGRDGGRGAAGGWGEKVGRAGFYSFVLTVLRGAGFYSFGGWWTASGEVGGGPCSRIELALPSTRPVLRQTSAPRSL
eukprot:6198986-Pleurochrysis_carterae.AAC.1